LVRIIVVASGKGGVGKTTISANLAVALQMLGKKVAVVDCNLTTAHLGLLFGIYSYPATLNNLIRNEASVENVTYTHFTGLHIVPASIDIRDLACVDTENFKTMLKDGFSNYDIVILDSSPGLGKEAMTALQAADEVLFVVTPTIPSLVDVVKCRNLINSVKQGAPILGVVINRVKGKDYEVTPEEVRRFTELPVVGIIPEDDNVLESTNRKSIVVLSKENSQASQAIFRISARVAGMPNFIPIPEKFYKKRGFFGRIISRLTEP
jgi:septum site-determining protein MinD